MDVTLAYPTKAKSRKQAIRVPWTDEELELLRKALAHCLHGYASITEAQRRFPVLQKRTLAQIKSHFHQLQKMLSK